MLRNFQTVRPIFPKIAAKVVQDFKEKSHESSRRGKKIPRNYRAKCRGGGFRPPPPPPPALLGLSEGGYTVEPRYNEVLGTIQITLLYQVFHYIRVKKKRNIKSLDQQNYLVIRGFCYIRPLYNEVPLYLVGHIINIYASLLAETVKKLETVLTGDSRLTVLLYNSSLMLWVGGLIVL